MLRMGSQGVFGMRGNIAKVMHVGNDGLRVLTGNVGGSFGMKSSVYPEYPALLHAARTSPPPMARADRRVR